MPTKLVSDGGLTYTEKLSAKWTGYSYWLDGIFVLIYNKEYNSQGYQEFIPACLTLLSVGWLQRKLKHNQKVIC